MKLSGNRMPRMPAALSLLVAYLTSTDAVKLHSESAVQLLVSDMDQMEGAANVAQVAYEQQLISANTWKALSNVTSFLEAAHSAGLDWTHADAQRHIVFTAHAVKSMISSSLQSNQSVSHPRLSQALSKGKEGFDGLKSMMEDEDKIAFGDEVLGATVGLLTNWATSGKPPSLNELATVGFDLATTAIGMFNPLLGQVAAMAFSIIDSLLFPQEESPMEKMYKAIMKEVGTAITREIIKQNIVDLTAELGAIMKELQWMPTLLGGVGSGPAKTPLEAPKEQARVLLTYNIMIQHDVAKIAFKIQQSPFGKPEVADASAQQWAAAMLPLSKELIMLQTNLLFDIGAHNMVKNHASAAARILELLDGWKQWIDANMWKAQQANARAAKDTLGWGGPAVKKHCNHQSGPGQPQHCDNNRYATATSKSCHVQGINACLTMQCPKDGTEHNCGVFPAASGLCGGMCYSQSADDFYWQYLAPKVSKISDDVQKMIVALGDEAATAGSMGRGFCRNGYYDGHTAADAKDLETCERKCLSESQCRFFALWVGRTCSRYNSGAGDCSQRVSDQNHVLYRRPRSPGPLHYADGHCTPTAVYSSDSWAVAGGWKHHHYGTAQYKSWVKRAWAKCLEEDAETTHVAVFVFGLFSCYRTSNCGAKVSYQFAKIWTMEERVAPVTMKFHSDGHCSSGQLYNSNPWALGDHHVGQQSFDTRLYKTWVRKAWATCRGKDHRTEYVSVFPDAGFRCYSACVRSQSPGSSQTWAPAP